MMDGLTENWRRLRVHGDLGRRVAGLEISRRRAYRLLARTWARLGVLATELLAVGGEGHAKNDAGEWVIYRAEHRPTEEYPHFVTWFLDRSVQDVTEPEHVALAQRIHDLMVYAVRHNGRRREVLDRALDVGLREVLEGLPKKLGRLARVRVNGRDYWYACEGYPERPTTWHWKKFRWADEDTIHVEVAR